MIARKLKAESSLGRMLDPIADKLIVSAALLMLASDGTLQGIHLVPALVILCREILVSGLREFLAGADVSLPVTRVAKMKTVMQMVAIAALIASSASERMLPGVTAAALVGLWAAAGLTFYTGYAYLQAGLHHARGAPMPRTKTAGPPSGPNKEPRESAREAALFRLGAAEDRPVGRRAGRARFRHQRFGADRFPESCVARAMRRRFAI